MTCCSFRAATCSDMQSERVDLSALAQTVTTSWLRAEQPVPQVELVIQPGWRPAVTSALLEIVLTNLFSNAWKFTGQRPTAHIEFGRTEVKGRQAFFMCDNGLLFFMALLKCCSALSNACINCPSIPGPV